MPETIRVNLHCHSHHSDGELPPALLADRLAASGVRAIALTDHDTVEGLKAFQDALAGKGIGVVSGVELSVTGPQGEELHILGYGFDPKHPALREFLGRINGGRRPAYRLSRVMPFSGGRAAADRPESSPGEGSPGAFPPFDRALRAVREAGGLAFLAHPVLPGQPFDPPALERQVERLKEAGLDGLEAYYPGYSPETSAGLAALAEAHGLLVSGGSDYHGPSGPGSADLFMDLPAAAWRRFRDALLIRKEGSGRRPAAVSGHPRRKLPGLRWNAFLLRILLPTVLAIGLFVAFLFRILIPSFEDRLLDRKRETIREVTNVAFSILGEYEDDVRRGRATLEGAQRAAADRIRNLRYGAEGKDYFWIQDLRPRMIMHPYRPDLDGRDLSEFQDPRGVRIFVEFVRTLHDRADAYVEYVWQWKDNPDLLAPKQSYIKKFAPWGWIVGTGLYLDDVRAEIQAMASRLVRVSAGISALCALLLGFVALQSMRIERRRRKAEDELHESHWKYRTLAESATEGTLMILDGRPTFANPTLLEMLGYAEDELELIDLEDLFPPDSAARPDGVAVAAALAGGTDSLRLEETLIRRRGGGRLTVALTATPISFAGRKGYVLAVRDLSGGRGRESSLLRKDAGRENLIAELQASLMFLHEPVAPSAAEPVFCGLRDPASKAAALMTARGVSAAVVVADGEPVGIVTDHDLRARLVAPGLPADRPVVEFMSAPLVSIGPRALVYEAILAMRENNVDHLLVRDEGGRVVGLLRNRDLLLFHRYSLAVLTQEIRHAGSVEAIAAARRGLPHLVRALIDGGAKARNVTRAVTAVTDAVGTRLIDLALEKLGPPPAAFAFLVLGSQGREEQTLASDQDHALIFEDAAEDAGAKTQAYFLELGRFVSEGMASAGIPLCRGGIMAGQPKWCQPLRVWKRYFSGWLGTAEPQDILDLKIFFDFRTLYGKPEFALELRRHIDAALKEEPPFLLHYAQYTLQYKVPRGLFGQLVTEPAREGGRALNLKDALMPVVNFARLYAFRNGVQETNTLDRLFALLEIGVLKPALHDEAVQVYDYLTQLRFGHQARTADRGETPDNDLDLREITHLDETLLKQAFSQIAGIQKKISFDFLGSA